VRHAVRAFFDSRDFLEVETPVVVPSPGLDLHLSAFMVLQGDGREPRWLSTSPELQMKRLLAAGFDRIYQLAPCFRRGEVGSLHSPQFTMLEWYRTPGGMDDVIGDTEQLVASVTGGEVRLEGRRVALSPPFERLSVTEAFERYADWPAQQTLDAATTDPDAFFRTLVERVEPAIARLEHAVWLVDYPASQASLARLKPGDPRFAERFELYVAGVELCNGFGELVDPVEQRRRFAQQQAERAERGLPVYPVDERFIEALGQLGPTGGNALGFDRLVALACGTTDIGPTLAIADDDL
jgi:lysyl-tRNA synthetase class 2